MNIQETFTTIFGLFLWRETQMFNLSIQHEAAASRGKRRGGQIGPSIGDPQELKINTRSRHNCEILLSMKLELRAELTRIPN